MASTDYISRVEHEEFSKRIDDSQKRQDNDIADLDDRLTVVEKLSLAVEKLATNMESMCKEQASQGKRLRALEDKDSHMWREAVRMTMSAVIGLAVGYLFNH